MLTNWDSPSVNSPKPSGSGSCSGSNTRTHAAGGPCKCRTRSSSLASWKPSFVVFTPGFGAAGINNCNLYRSVSTLRCTLIRGSCVRRHVFTPKKNTKNQYSTLLSVCVSMQPHDFLTLLARACMCVCMFVHNFPSSSAIFLHSAKTCTISGRRKTLQKMFTFQRCTWIRPVSRSGWSPPNREKLFTKKK